MENVSTGVLDKNKEHYSRCKDKAEESYDVLRHIQLHLSKYKICGFPWSNVGIIFDWLELGKTDCMGVFNFLISLIGIISICNDIAIMLMPLDLNND